MIYVASSWRNPHQQGVVAALREQGHDVYDFRNPRPGETGFHWREIDPSWLAWTPAQFRQALLHPLAVGGFFDDFVAMHNSGTFVLVLPCNRSSHLEFGWAIGKSRTSIVYMPEPSEPELMYRMADKIVISLDELIAVLAP